MDKEQIIAELVDGIAKHFGNALQTAFAKGFAAGQEAARLDATRQAREKFQTLLENVFKESVAPEVFQTEPEDVPLEEHVGRAKRGSAPPLVLSALDRHWAGITAKELARELSGQLEENTVRGTLNRLRHGGKVLKKGDRWFKKPSAK